MRPFLGSIASVVLLSFPLFTLACGGGAGNEADVGSSSAAVTQVCGASPSGPVQGRDVSVYQGNFDWNTAGVTFGYARVSDGLGYDDPDFAGNWAHMAQAGLLRGAYQFFEPGEDPTAQANLVVSKIGKLGAGDLPAMIDVEVTGGRSPSEMASEIRTWLQVVEAGTGLRPIIYVGSYFWQSNVQDTSFGAYPVWIAAYGTACPSVPAGWSDWTFWQYSDGNGTLDHDVFNGSLAQLKALSATPAPPPGPPTATPKAPSGCGEIEPGQGLARGETYDSCDGRFTLAMQTDGNLVLYAAGSAMWDTGTAGSDGFAAIMQGDGNFVLYGKTSDPLWSSGTAGHGGAFLALQTDGNLVVYSTGGKALWDSHTNVPAAPPKPTGCGELPAGTALTIGESESSCDGRFSLVMQGDGNLVLYENGKSALWSSGTAGKPGYMAVMQGDGNFVLYDRHGSALWSSGSAGHDGAWLAVQGDGNLVVYAKAGGAYYWNSGTAGH